MDNMKEVSYSMAAKNTVPVTSYIPPALKQRMERVVAEDRHMTISRLIDEAVERYLGELERRSFPKPTQEPHENN
jgi:hypothetical protein